MYNVYKGLQKPLIYKGFKGKYIFWGLGSLVAGLTFGAIISSTVNTYLGALVGVSSVVGGLFYTANKQKGGLYNKTKHKGIFIHEIKLDKFNNHGKKSGI